MSTDGVGGPFGSLASPPRSFAGQMYRILVDEPITQTEWSTSLEDRQMPIMAGVRIFSTYMSLWQFFWKTTVLYRTDRITAQEIIDFEKSISSIFLVPSMSSKSK